MALALEMVSKVAFQADGRANVCRGEKIPPGRIRPHESYCYSILSRSISMVAPKRSISRASCEPPGVRKKSRLKSSSARTHRRGRLHPLPVTGIVVGFLFETI